MNKSASCIIALVIFIICMISPHIVSSENRVVNHLNSQKKYDIEFMVIISESIEESIRITVSNDSCHIKLFGAFLCEKEQYYYVDSLEANFKLSHKQCHRINTLISDIDNKNHFGIIADYYDCCDAYLWINKKQIYYTSDFKLPSAMKEQYSKNKSLDELIRYLINLSPKNIINKLEQMIKQQAIDGYDE